MFSLILQSEIRSKKILFENDFNITKIVQNKKNTKNAHVPFVWIHLLLLFYSIQFIIYSFTVLDIFSLDHIGNIAR